MKEPCDKKNAWAEEFQRKWEEDALKAEVTITLEKKAGSMAVRKIVQASSTRAAMNALAMLIQATAKMLDMTDAKVLAVLAVVLTESGYPAKEERRAAQ